MVSLKHLIVCIDENKNAHLKELKHIEFHYRSLDDLSHDYKSFILEKKYFKLRDNRNNLIIAIFMNMLPCIFKILANEVLCLALLTAIM